MLLKNMKFAPSLLFAAVGMYRAVDAFAPSAPIAASTNLVVPTGRICANSILRTSSTNSCLAMSASRLPDFDVIKVDQAEAVAMAKQLSDTIITSLSSTGVTLPKLESIDLSTLSSLSLGKGISTDEVSSKVNEALNEFLAWAQPQAEALADYVVADLSKYWDSYVAALEAKDTGAIIGTGWGGIIFLLITANTLARGSSEERRLAKFEAEQAAKEAAAEAAASKAKKGGLFGAAKAGPSRLQMRQEKEAKAAARKKELEQKKFASALKKRAKENKAAFDKKQKEKKKKEAQRRRVLKTDFQQRKGLGRFAKKK